MYATKELSIGLESFAVSMYSDTSTASFFFVVNEVECQSSSGMTFDIFGEFESNKTKKEELVLMNLIKSIGKGRL